MCWFGNGLARSGANHTQRAAKDGLGQQQNGLETPAETTVWRMWSLTKLEAIPTSVWLGMWMFTRKSDSTVSVCFCCSPIWKITSPPRNRVDRSINAAEPGFWSQPINFASLCAKISDFYSRLKSYEQFLHVKRFNMVFKWLHGHEFDTLRVRFPKFYMDRLDLVPIWCQYFQLRMDGIVWIVDKREIPAALPNPLHLSEVGCSQLGEDKWGGQLLVLNYGIT